MSNSNAAIRYEFRKLRFQMIDDKEIVTNSNITLLKLKIFELAFLIASAGFVVTCVAAFGHLLGM